MDDDWELADPAGITAADMPLIHRELFRAALAGARLEHDPAVDWEAFCAAAWQQVAYVFELDA